MVARRHRHLQPPRLPLLGRQQLATPEAGTEDVRRRGGTSVEGMGLLGVLVARVPIRVKYRTTGILSVCESCETFPQAHFDGERDSSGVELALWTLGG